MAANKKAAPVGKLVTASRSFTGNQFNLIDYGLLHSPDYRKRYADNLAKELPRIPCVKTAADFWAFAKAGRDLAELHLHYETVEKYPLQIVGNPQLTDADYRVEKMKYGTLTPTLSRGRGGLHGVKT
ncbi:type ISP restriction/modification enzyme [Methylomonas koyamae]|uniref:type ISP restriction/modification enzyme n=1 Tax=Methylomonas koyamae TaxID=702114 RepID=UPI0006D15912|nr:type ISP restriction/modification enzyme [Methylomonas koyamae]